MKPVDVCRMVYGAGLSIRVDGDNLALRPAELLTPGLREVLVANKPELIHFLREAEWTAALLVEPAMRCCDHHCDGATARQQMRDDLAQVPPHQRSELLDHFNTEYRAAFAHFEQRSKACASGCRFCTSLPK